MADIVFTDVTRAGCARDPSAAIPHADMITGTTSTFIPGSTSQAPAPQTAQFSTRSYSVSEDAGAAIIIVTRSGDAFGAATINYATSNAGASDRSDYALASGTLHFAAGETSKSFSVLITDDATVEGNETVNITLNNPFNIGMGNPSTATLTIIDDDTTVAATNPVDSAEFFVRQHYMDFLNRLPDDDGLAFWTNQIASCGADAGCTETKRVNVSAAFFLSIEFQETDF